VHLRRQAQGARRQRRQSVARRSRELVPPPPHPQRGSAKRRSPATKVKQKRTCPHAPRRARRSPAAHLAAALAMIATARAHAPARLGDGGGHGRRRRPPQRTGTAAALRSQAVDDLERRGAFCEEALQAGRMGFPRPSPNRWKVAQRRQEPRTRSGLQVHRTACPATSPGPCRDTATEAL
jgi:hypothetical protein